MNLPQEIHNYLSVTDPTFAWSLTDSPNSSSNDISAKGVPQAASTGSVRRVDMDLTSQTWRGIIWQHRLTLFLPTTPVHEDLIFLNIGSDGPCSKQTEEIGMRYAERSGLVCAFLFDVPNQPLFDGLIEDQLIAHTLVQYLDTGESDWPLLLPMVKSAVAAMNAIREYLNTSRVQPSEACELRVVLSGASKRGWTTWLTAAHDDRVIAIAPIVFDNLNLFAQMPHQLEVFETYSDEIGDYSESGLMERVKTPAGAYLSRIVDPFTYRSELTLPKLIINGSNDPYWATDAINLYWWGLHGDKNVLYVPNEGHGIGENNRTTNTILEFVCRVASDRPMPEFSVRNTCATNLSSLYVEHAVGASGASLWVARSGSLDFRLATWQELPMQGGEDGGFSSEVELSDQSNYAIFVEVTFPGFHGDFTLSSPMNILRAVAES